MKISELIIKLEDLKNLEGDLEVATNCWNTNNPNEPVYIICMINGNAEYITISGDKKAEGIPITRL